MTQEESKLMEEHRKRQELRNIMELIAGLWCSFAQIYHGIEYADAEHAFGVLVREYHEALESSQSVRMTIRRFEDTCLRTHCYDEAAKIMKEIFEFSVAAAEEFAQLAGVAQKAIGSGLTDPQGENTITLEVSME